MASSAVSGAEATASSAVSNASSMAATAGSTTTSATGKSPLRKMAWKFCLHSRRYIRSPLTNAFQGLRHRQLQVALHLLPKQPQVPLILSAQTWALSEQLWLRLPSCNTEHLDDGSGHRCLKYGPIPAMCTYIGFCAVI